MKRLFSSFAPRASARALALVSIPLLCLTWSVSSQEGDATEAAPAAAEQTASGDVERGRYLVESVGMCAQCHSTRDAKGNLKKDDWLHGAPVPVSKPVGYVDTWAYRAPRIAGLPQHTDEEFVEFLTTGVNRDGKEAMPPMPPYRFTEEDALAIAAYLRSLP